MSARIGFKVTVHMSADARASKGNCSHGVGSWNMSKIMVLPSRKDVKQRSLTPNCFFINDGDPHVVPGYSVAGQHLKAQVPARPYRDADNPLFVYLPCGVGGGRW
ncbi:hypothetical protein ACLK1T_21900 [Escherichia coli]